MQDTTAQLLEHHFGLAADNSHTHYLEVRALVVATAARVPADREPIASVENVLRDFYRDRMAYVVDASTGRLRMDWREEREKFRTSGENLEHAPGYRSWEDSPQEALQAIARELLATAIDVLDWSGAARELLEEEHDGGTLADAAGVLRALLELEGSSDADPVAGEVPVGTLADRLGLETGALADRLEELRRLGLASTRFVGGTSGTLAHSRTGPPLSPYVPDRVQL